MRKWYRQIKNVFCAIINYILYDINIKNKLYTIIIIITLVPIVVLGVKLYSISKSNIIATENNILIQSTKQLGNVVDFYLEMIINKSDIVYRNLTIQDILTKEYDDTGEVINMYNDLIKTLTPLISELKYPNMKYSRFSMKNSSKTIITIYSKNPTINMLNRKGPFNIIIDDLQSIENADWFKSMQTFSDSTFFWRLPYEVSNGDKTEKYISLNREFINITTMKEIGILSIGIPEENIKEVLKNNIYSKDWSAYLLTNEGQIISKSSNPSIEENILPKINKEIFLNQNDGFFNIIRGKLDSRIYYTTSNVSGWKIMIAAPNIAITEGINKIMVTTIFISILSFIGAVLLMMILARVITGRLQRLINKICSIGNDTSKFLEVIQGKDEIGELDHQFNNLICRINELIEKEYKIILNAKLIEVELLQEQINPHLLYNSLSAIRWMANKYNIASIYKLTEDLICFYKASLSKGDIFIKLSEEINMIDEYVSLFCGVYKLDLDYRKEIDERINNFYCMKLILQPAVENALIHGLKMNNKGGKIGVKGMIEGDLVILEVSDNGVGMDEETIRHIFDDLMIGKKNFGIYNVNKRIKLFYGDKYGLKISSKSGEGTTVQISIPTCSKNDIETICKEKQIFNMK